jgi:hypothetical protein
MIDFNALRDRLSSDSAAEEDRRDPPAGETLPFAGYDQLDEKQVMAALSDRSQVELEATEAYERAHEDRARVLDKLRYMRGDEPLPGYDRLEVSEVVAALNEADWTTIKKVRAYERKFANRPAVLDEVVRVHRRHQRASTAAPAAKYQPSSTRGR